MQNAGGSPKWDNSLASLYLAMSDLGKKQYGWSNAVANITVYDKLMNFGIHDNKHELHIARLGVDLAGQYEREGQIEKGFRIRKIVFLFGENITSRATSIADAASGVRIEQIALESGDPAISPLKNAKAPSKAAAPRL